MNKRRENSEKLNGLLAIALMAGTVIFTTACTSGNKTRREPAREDAAAQSENPDEEGTGKSQESSAKDEDDTDENGDTAVTSAPTSIIFTGDVNLKPAIQANYDQSGLDGVLDPDMQALLQKADILAINNEFSFSTQGSPMPNKQYTFRVDPRYVKVLNDMSVDCASVANNHALDYGKAAFSDTLTTLENAGIQHIGGGQNYEECAAPGVFEKNGETFAILSASRVIPVAGWNIDNDQPGMLTTYDPTELLNEIRKNARLYDHVLVYVHWGVEYQEYPEEYQKDFARQYIDAGADAVIGGHPHCLQGIEYYKGKPICYSLGNFMFFANTDPLAAVELDMQGDSTTLRVIPAYAVSSRTCLARDDHAWKIYSYLESISSGITIDAEGIVHPSE